MRVLVVEDDADIATLISVAFRREGNDVEVVGSGTAALRAIEADPPEVMILDLNLPDVRAPSTCTWAGCGPSGDRPATRSRRCSVSAIGSPRTLQTRNLHALNSAGPD